MADARRNRSALIGSHVSCHVCTGRESIQTAEDHHRVPRAFGGSDDPNNRVWLCPSCHTRIHTVQGYLIRGKVESAISLCREIFPTNGSARGRLWELANEAAAAERESKDSFIGHSQYQKVTISVDRDVWAILKSEAKSRKTTASKMAAQILKKACSSI